MPIVILLTSFSDNFKTVDDADKYEVKIESGLSVDDNDKYSVEIESGLDKNSTELEEPMELLELKDAPVGDTSLSLENTMTDSFSFKSTSLDLKLTTSNRRYSLRPQKRLQITEYPVTSSKQRLMCVTKTSCLETIFEDPSYKNGSIVLLGRALKRSIAFNNSSNKAKVKRRKLKIKRLSTSKRKNSKITLEDVKRKLSSLNECENN